MKVLVSCGTKFHSDHLVNQLNKRKLLDKFITSHPFFLFNRVHIPLKNTIFLPPIFLLELLTKKLTKNKYLNSFIQWQLIRLYDFLASLFVSKKVISISWAWASLKTIKKVKSTGGIAILEECGSCNKYQENLLNEEYKKLNIKYDKNTSEKIINRELKEAHEADYILCPSKHVADSFKKFDIPEEKLIINPYGVDNQLFCRSEKTNKKFQVLFVGTIGVRKGVYYLLEAVKDLNLKNFECLLIGRVEPDFESIFNKYKKYIKHIQRVDHDKLNKYYSNASIFVFPSLDEGMAYVQLEAMSCGLPIICTMNSGGDSIIEDGKNGYIIPIRNSEIIKKKIEHLYNYPDKLIEMSNYSEKKARDFTWDAYGNRLEKILNRILNEKNMLN